ncbi:YhbY family RNA-binding protein [Halococcus agarilyticus]|uniref:YhbY family RNA-binding protein n=1 Tax=Halococcus agarilyticus TaxID=1232219 RepID=UPI0006779124|nr:YhbY family RNA-binding protein [Halococcus agarilyticus]
MTKDERTLRERAHEVDATLRVGKGGVDAVAGELESQLRDRDLVKVKFLRAARGGTTTDELAERLAEQAAADVIETRGNTATYH